MKAMAISRTGMDVEWRRLEVIADNLANASSVTNGLGEPYQTRRLISGPKFDIGGPSRPSAPPQGAEVYAVESANLPPSRVYEPGNPQADSEGFVTRPGFDHSAEMLLMLKASRTYEANLVALNAARDMYLKALELGGTA